MPIEQDRPENRANDIKVDSRGRAWVGTMAFDKRPGSAALYRVEAGKANCVVDGLTISNGPALDEVQGRFTSPIPLCVSLTCSTWSRKRVRCPVAVASLTSATNRSGRTA